MGMKLHFPFPPEITPEQAAIAICSKQRRKLFILKYATHRPKSLKQSRIEWHQDLAAYYRSRGSGYVRQMVERADCAANKVCYILNQNLEDWNSYRRAQQFRRLDELLLAFERELRDSRPAEKQTANVMPFPQILFAR